MFSLHRWWEQRGLQLTLLGVSLAGIGFLWYTHGSLVYDIYAAIARPLFGQKSAPPNLTNAKIQELQAQLVELESRNRELQELLGYLAEGAREDAIAAPIIGRSADHWWQQVLLGRGQDEDVRVGFAVVGAGGLVGRVVSVTDRTSQVLLISDPTSRVGVTVSRTRSMGFIQGQGSNRAVMEFFDQTPDVRVGDVVATSSYSVQFPPGIPVGRIVALDLSKSPAPQATIELFAPIEHLEVVALYPHEAVEEDWSDRQLQPLEPSPEESYSGEPSP